MRKFGWILLAVLFCVAGVPRGQAAVRDILVIQGQFDKIESVLTDLGFADRMNVVPDDEAIETMDFSGYKALFINCDYYGITDRPDQALLDRVRDYVHGGGMLYVTDDAANFLQSWDAEMGYTIRYDESSFESGNWKTVVVDPALKAKFPSDRFDAAGNIVIHHSSDNGEPIVDAGRATVLLKNANDTESWSGAPDEVQAIDFRPSAGGRVVYTTFHNHPDESAPEPGDGDDYIAYQNVLTVMRHICGSLGTATEQELLMDLLGANVADLVGNPQGGPFSDLFDTGWTFETGSQASLTFAVYAATSSASGMSVRAAATTDPIFTLTAPNGDVYRAQGNPANAPVVFHVGGQSGLWALRCTGNGSVVAASRSTTGMVLDGVFGAASPEPSITVVPTKLQFTISDTRIEAGESRNLLVSFVPADTTERGLTWKVDDPLIASVTKSTSGADLYVVKGLLRGTARLTATSTADAGVSESIDITVVGDDSSGKSGGGGCDAGMGFGLLGLAVCALAAFKYRL